VMALPVVKSAPHPTAAAGPPPAPSRNFAEYQGKGITLKYPDNWTKYEDNNGVTFAPEGGVLQGSNGQGEVAYGMIVSVNPVQVDSNDPNALENATQRLIQNLQKANPNMKISRQPERVKLNGQPALSTYLSNDSPASGKETDWLVTVLRPEELVSFLGVAPQAAFSEYEKAFNTMLDSVRF
jgi:hypothetical protein